MLKKTITYEDYNGVTRTEDFYFNLTKAELLEMELGHSGGYAEMLQKIVDANDTPSVMRVFKDIILKSYGKKSEDGRRFVKSPEISREFEETPAYSQLFVELGSNAAEASKFVTALIPSDMQVEVKTELAKHPELKMAANNSAATE